jgi:hypothetical protein
MPTMLYETFKLLPLNLCLLHPLKLCLKNSDIPIAVQNSEFALAVQNFIYAISPA